MAESEFNQIIIAGERYRLTSGVKAVTFEDRGGMSFRRHRARGVPLYSKRYKDDEPVEDLETLKKVLQQVVLHSDLAVDSEGCFDILVDRGLSTHFMIDWDGTIYQGLDPLEEAFHAGEANNRSIGVDLNNKMPNLVRQPDAGPYPPGHACYGREGEDECKRPTSDRMQINGGNVRSYGYTDPQYTALLSLLQVLTKVFDRIEPAPPFDEKNEIIPTVLEDAAGFQGILAHWHLSASRWDPGPGFDWQRMYHGLAREHNAFPIELEEGKNIATLLEPDKVKAYAERYYRNNEHAMGGGWYPVGINQNWHGGIHLHQPKGSPVYAMFDGVLVAGRFGDKPTRMGHNNFLVFRHEVDIPTRKEGESRTLVFYSLYMHLAPMTVSEVKSDSPEWVKALHRTQEDDEAREDALEGGKGEETRGGDSAFWEEGEDLSRYADEAYLTVGQRLAAFRRGEIALIPWQESPIEVSSGEMIGHVGKFGAEGAWGDLVHVEIFTETGWKQAIDLGVHGRYLVELEPDLSSDLFVENRQILDLFEGVGTLATEGSLVEERVLAPGDIEYLYNAEDSFQAAKRWLRKVVTRHVSEWSDQVDWVQSLSKAEDWEARTEDFEEIIERSGIFRKALQQVLPFVWLNQEVASHIGLNTENWSGVLYHFHPIHFLIWLTYHASQRVQTLSRGKSLEAIKKQLEEEQKQEEEGDLQQRDASVAATIRLEDIEATSAESVLEDWFYEQGQGEWQVPWGEET